MKSRWRHTAREVIEDVMRENPDLAEKELRNKISDAYPFGQRSLHPYKIWLSEVKKQIAKRGFGKITKSNNELF